MLETLAAPVRAPALAPGREGDADKACGLFALIRAVDLPLRQAAAGTADVLVRGEPGTGKELFARAVHAHSPRSGAPFVRIVCGAPALAETDPRAWLAAAGPGTLFLDEIADLTPAAQLALVRALQMLDGEAHDAARRRGPRLVCSSAHALETLVAGGGFRADLYYRVHVVSIALPALRRLAAGEIEALAAFFLARHNAATGRAVRLSPHAAQRFVRCRWPGNLRELENCVENAATLAIDGVITGAALPCKHCLARVLAAASCESGTCNAASGLEDESALETSQQARRRQIVAALQRCGWVQAKAARLLGLTPRQIGYAIRQLEIEVLRL
jgi:Nif-specific regulatory protein